jgi:hypothetical protein
VCAVLFVSTQAAAQSASRRSSREREPVTLQLRVVHPGTRATVTLLDRRFGSPGQLILQCQSVCSQQLPVGQYKLTLEYPDGEREPDAETVLLRSTTEFISHPPDRGLRTLGLTLLISGPLLLVSGLSALLPNVFELLLCHSSSCGSSWNAWTTAGVIVSPLGLAMGVVGFVLFKRNRWPFERAELPATPQARVEWSVQVNALGALVAGTF